MNCKDVYKLSMMMCIHRECTYGRTWVCCNMHILAENMILRGEY